MTDLYTAILDVGSFETFESSRARASVADVLFRLADRCVRMMSEACVFGTLRHRADPFCETRVFPKYSGRAKVHARSIAKKVNPVMFSGDHRRVGCRVQVLEWVWRSVAIASTRSATIE
jgi:hypothetical protein